MIIQGSIGRMAFFRRHPNLSLRVPEALSRVWANATEKEVIIHYFELVKDTYTKNNITQPSQVIY